MIAGRIAGGPGYDLGEGRRRWRALDLGTTYAYVEADAPRVECRRHGVVVAAVPWARHDSWFTRAFEDQTAWLAVNTSATAVAALMRVTWRAVGSICQRVTADAQRTAGDLLDGLKRLGFDEISVRKGQTYLTVVVDHDSGRLVWAAPGRDRKTVERFLDLLGDERCKRIELVSCDMAEWITRPVAERCPNAQVCLDPFHVTKRPDGALAVSHLRVGPDDDQLDQHVLAPSQLHATAAGACLLDHAATLRDTLDQAGHATVSVDVTDDALDSAIDAWGPPAPPG